MDKKFSNNKKFIPNEVILDFPQLDSIYFSFTLQPTLNHYKICEAYQ